MGAISNLRSITPPKLGWILDDPGRIEAFLSSNPPPFDEKQEGPDFAADSTRYGLTIRLEKSLDRLCYLMTKRAWEETTSLDCQALSDRFIYDTNVGDGVASYLTAQQIAAVLALIKPLTQADLLVALRPRSDAMHADLVYPSDGTCYWRWGEEDFPWLWENFVRLREFYRAVVANGNAVLSWLN